MHFVRLNHAVIERTRNVHLHYSRLHNVCVCSVWLFFAKYSMSNRTSLKQQLWYYRRRYIFHTPSWDFVFHQKKPALSCLLAHCQSQNMCSARAARLVGYSKSNKGGRIFVKSQLHFCFPNFFYDSLTELESLRGIRIRTRIIQFLTEVWLPLEMLENNVWRQKPRYCIPLSSFPLTAGAPPSPDALSQCKDISITCA